MQTTQDWPDLFNSEIQAAIYARLAGAEGKARVCARRAAGIAVGEYLRRQGINFQNPSAIERLKYLQNLPDLSPSVQRAADLLLLRVTPNYILPVEADLIAEARLLVDELLTD